ncbi:MAG: hypothetical protein K6E93_00495 [Bacteroidales bacterium]|nr:hypothetical protein [Bacteroidales bacterium]
MANLAFNPLNQWRGRLGGIVYKVVGGKQIAQPYMGAPRNPRTTAQTAQRSKFALAGMISKIVPAEILVGMRGQRSRRRAQFFSHIVRHATATVSTTGITASLDAADLVFSQGMAAPVTVSGVTSSDGVVSGTVDNMPDTVDALMVIAVVYDTTAGVYTHTTYEVLPADNTSVSLDISGAESGNVAHLYAVPMTITDTGRSYFRSADGAERSATDGFELTMLMRTTDDSYQYGQSQYLASVDLGSGDNGGNSSGGNGSGNSGNTPGGGDDNGGDLGE